MKKIWPGLVLFALGLILVLPWLVYGGGEFAGSMAPVTLIRAKFIQQNWPHLDWFPDWYLGTPHRFLASPLIPFFLAFLAKLGLEMGLAYRWLVGFGLSLLPVAVWFLVESLKTKKVRSEAGLIAGLVALTLPGLVFVFPQTWGAGRLFGFTPWSFLSAIYLGNGLRVWGLGLSLFQLGLAWRYLQGRGRLLGPVLLGGLVLLTDLGSVVSWLVGLAILMVCLWLQKKTAKKYRVRLGRVLLLALGLVAFVYTPRFWFQHLSAPSIGGKRALSVGLFLTRTLSVLIPLVLGVMAVGKKKKRTGLANFTLLWGVVFGLLTLARWLADTDFWQDYTSWGMEVGVGVGLMVAGWWMVIQKKAFKTLGVVLAVVLTLGWWIGWPTRLGSSAKFQSLDSVWLNYDLDLQERVFLSGSQVFKYEEAQVRGGQDQAAVHPAWADGAYQIREGKETQLAADWLRAFGVGWVLVHEPSSSEVYRDFKWPAKFSQEPFLEIERSEGDVVHRLPYSGLAREVGDWDEFINLDPPTAGNDSQTLAKYNSLIYGLIPLRRQANNEFLVEPTGEGGVSLAVSFDPGWSAVQAGQKLKIEKDGLGQLAVWSQSAEPIEFRYSYPVWDRLLGLGISLVAFWGLADRADIINNRRPHSSTDRAQVS